MAKNIKTFLSNILLKLGPASARGRPKQSGGGETEQCFMSRFYQTGSWY